MKEQEVKSLGPKVHKAIADSSNKKVTQLFGGERTPPRSAEPPVQKKPVERKRFSCVVCDTKNMLLFGKDGKPSRGEKLHELDPQGHFCKQECLMRYGMSLFNLAELAKKQN